MQDRTEFDWWWNDWGKIPINEDTRAIAVAYRFDQIADLNDSIAGAASRTKFLLCSALARRPDSAFKIES